MVLGLLLVSMAGWGWAPGLTPVYEAAQVSLGLARIQGRVLSPSDDLQLPDNLLVTLTSVRRDYMRTLNVGRTGEFEFEQLREGYYVIRVESPGFKPSEQSVAVAGSRRGEIITVLIPVGERIGSSESSGLRNESSTVSTSMLSLSKEVRTKMEKAEKASAKGKSLEAIGFLEEALKIQPDLSEAHTNIAVQYLHLGLSDRAREHLKKAIELNPKDALAHGNLGMLYYRARDYDQAIDELKAAQEIDPGRDSVLTLMGECYFSLGRYREALNQFERAYAANQSNHGILLRMGDCHLRLGAKAEAVVSLRRFLREAPDDARAPGVESLLRQLGESFPRNRPR